MPKESLLCRSFVRVQSATAAMNSSTESTKEWNHVMDYDVTLAALGCHVPVAYVGAAISLADLTQFKTFSRKS
jgi:hypothetical protein